MSQRFISDWFESNRLNASGELGGALPTITVASRSTLAICLDSREQPDQAWYSKNEISVDSQKWLPRRARRHAKIHVYTTYATSIVRRNFSYAVARMWCSFVASPTFAVRRCAPSCERANVSPTASARMTETELTASGRS